MRQIFDNCEVFNEDDSPVGKAGHNMRKFFEMRWSELTEKGSWYQHHHKILFSGGGGGGGGTQAPCMLPRPAENVAPAQVMSMNLLPMEQQQQQAHQTMLRNSSYAEGGGGAGGMGGMPEINNSSNNQFAHEIRDQPLDQHHHQQQQKQDLMPPLRFWGGSIDHSYRD